MRAVPARVSRAYEGRPRRACARRERRCFQSDSRPLVSARPSAASAPASLGRALEQPQTGRTVLLVARAARTTPAFEGFPRRFAQVLPALPPRPIRAPADEAAGHKEALSMKQRQSRRPSRQGPRRPRHQRNPHHRADPGHRAARHPRRQGPEGMPRAATPQGRRIPQGHRLQRHGAAAPRAQEERATSSLSPGVSTTRAGKTPTAPNATAPRSSLRT